MGEYSVLKGTSGGVVWYEGCWDRLMRSTTCHDQCLIEVLVVIVRHQDT